MQEQENKKKKKGKGKNKTGKTAKAGKNAGKNNPQKELSEEERQQLFREALLARQREFRNAPGLVADGRDMGTVVFRDATLKIFLTASAEERAQRRYKQLIAKGESVSLPRLLRDIEERDERDRNRQTSPLVPAEDAIVIDSSAMPAQAVFERVLQEVEKKGLI